MEKGWGFVNEIPELLKPAAPTPREEEAAAKISSVDYAIYSEKLALLCEEAKEVFVRSGRTGMLIGGDLVVGIYNVAGDLVTGMAGSYIHAVTGTPTIKYILGVWKDEPSVGIKEGDMFFANDALFGILHCPDEVVVMPIFSDGEMIAWVAAGVQETEVGAIEPGLPATAHSRFDEGLKMPPVKISENYQLRMDVLNAMSNMTRTPEAHETDIRARASACDRVRIRLQQLAKERGNDFVIGLISRMLTETEKGAAQKVKSWYDGKYRSVVFVDSIGAGKEGLQKISLTLTKEDDHVLLDFTETSPENDGCYNNFAHAVIGHVVHVLFWGAFCDLPISTGLLSSHEFKFKPQTVLHASMWASTMVSPAYLCCIFPLVSQCYSKMMYPHEEDRKRIMAGTVSQSAIDFAGINQYNQTVADVHICSLNESGGGAACNRDGGDAMLFSHCPWGKAPELEDMEVISPLLHMYWSHLKDTGGPGRYRGGSAISTALMLHHTPWVGIHSSGYSSRIPLGLGLFGGYPNSTTALTTIRKSDAHDRMKAGNIVIPWDTHELITKRTIKGEYRNGALCTPMETFVKGDITTLSSAGGGGYGDVLERDPDAAMSDIKKQIVSHWAVQNVYKVAYDPDSLKVDYAKTEELRRQEREERKKRGKKYQEFEKEWLTRKPPEEALKFYGSWPDAEMVTPVVRI